MPGLIDTHLHGLDTADRPGYHALDVESATSIREVQDVLAAHRKTVPEGQWITAIGAAHTNLWAEHRFPTLKELDDAVPDRPVLLYQGFYGAAATNTLGKKFFDAADAAPPLAPGLQGRPCLRDRRHRRVQRGNRRTVHERAVPAAPAAEVRRQEAECPPHDGLFHERGRDRVARQVDDLCARTAASASGIGERRPLQVPRRLECGPHRRPDVDAGPDGLHRLRRARRQRDAEGIPQERVAVLRRRHAADRRHRRMAGARGRRRADARGAAARRAGTLALRQRRREPGRVDAAGRAARGRQQGRRHYRPAVEREPPGHRRRLGDARPSGSAPGPRLQHPAVLEQLGQLDRPRMPSRVMRTGRSIGTRSTRASSATPPTSRR